MSLADLLEELEAAKDSKKARSMEAYMRHQFSFLGLRCLKEINSIKIFSRSEKNKDYRLGFCRHLLGKGS